MKIDFLFLVEHEDREFATIEVLTSILREKGCSAVILSVEFHSHLFRKYKPKCVIFPYAIDSNSWLISYFPTGKKPCSFVSLNWEQLLSNANKEFKKPKGNLICDDFHHLAWNANFKDFLVENNVNEPNVEVLGNPAVELLHRACLNGEYWKEKLRKKFGVKENRKIVFLPMNYGWAFQSDNTIKAKIDMGYDRDVAWEYRAYSQRCLKSFVEFIRELSADASLHLVIRPHPSISIQQYFQVFEKCGCNIAEVENVTFTKEYTIKEWIAVSEVVGSSWSTSVWDAVCAGKKGFLFAPEERPEWLDTYWNSKVINVARADDFSCVTSMDREVEINPENIITSIAEWLAEIKKKQNFARNSNSKLFLVGYSFRSFFRDVSMKYFRGFGVPIGMQRDYFEPVEISLR